MVIPIIIFDIANVRVLSIQDVNCFQTFVNKLLMIKNKKINRYFWIILLHQWK